MVRALVVADDGRGFEFLAGEAFRLFGSGWEYLALEVSDSAVDPELAWGTRSPVVRAMIAPELAAGRVVFADELPAASARAVGAEVPLGEDGDSATAILDASRVFAVDVIVVAGRPETGLKRLVSASGTAALLRVTDVPVLVVPTH